jgi:hypothetical protein
VRRFRGKPLTKKRAVCAVPAREPRAPPGWASLFIQCLAKERLKYLAQRWLLLTGES